MSAQTDAIIALLSETAQKDLLEALQAKVAPEATAPAEPHLKLSMPCPVCGDLLEVTCTTTVNGHDDLHMYWCRGVNPLCRCSEGICMGETRPGEFSVSEMTEADLAKIREPVTVHHPVVDVYDEDEDEEWDEEDEDEEPSGRIVQPFCTMHVNVGPVTDASEKKEEREEKKPEYAGDEDALVKALFGAVMEALGKKGE